MGFDIIGLNAKSKKGEYFRNNVWAWRPLQCLILILCSEFLSTEQQENLSWNNGYEYDAKTAKRIGDIILKAKPKLAKLHSQIEGKLSEHYKEDIKFFKKNALNFAKFAKDSGGFLVG